MKLRVRLAILRDSKRIWQERDHFEEALAEIANGNPDGGPWSAAQAQGLADGALDARLDHKGEG